MADYIDTQGTILKIGDGASPEVFTAVPQVVSIDGPTASAEEIEVTHLTSVKREFRPALSDPGSLNTEIEWDERDTIHALLRQYFDNRTEFNIQIVDTGSPLKTANCRGFVKSLPLTYSANDVVRAAAEIRLTGDYTVA